MYTLNKKNIASNNLYITYIYPIIQLSVGALKSVRKSQKFIQNLYIFSVIEYNNIFKWLSYEKDAVDCVFYSYKQ